ncbi:MAG: hypothetical protein ABIL58_14110 [Pseudomonadota bacterium]
MMSLYQKLFKYALTENKSPLENFLTEALADLINRMSVYDAARFTGECLLSHSSDAGAALKIASRLAAAAQVNAVSQYSISFDGTVKYPDMAVFGDRLVMLIENKVGAGFTYDEVEDTNGQLADHGQLEAYSSWLSRNHPNAALVLLTHSTPPPPNFLTNHTTYGKQLRAVVYWPSVYKWLKRNLAGKSDEPIIGQLTDEFLTFLEGKGMSDISNMELSAMDIFLSNRINQKIATVMARARQVAAGTIQSIVSQAKSAANYYDDAQCVWDWCYCLDRELSWYIGWGLRFPDGATEWSSYDLPIYPQAFITIGSDNIAIPLMGIEVDRRLPDWLWKQNKDYSECFKITNLSELCADASGFSQAFLTWLEHGLKEASSIASLAYEVHQGQESK